MMLQLPESFWRNVGEHLLLAAFSIGGALLIAAPLAWLARKHRVLESIILRVGAMLQTIPGLALLALLLPVPGLGIGAPTAVVALILYALFPLLEAIVTGLGSVPQSLREAAAAMGMDRRETLWLLELPYALPVFLSGLRVACVSTIGTAALAGAIGGGGLGELIFRGIATVNMSLVLAGALPAAVLALMANGALKWIENKYSSWRVASWRERSR
jgi:osmoprotectant transport system permease protein